MCGIFGIIGKQAQQGLASSVEIASKIVNHRGPDDEGFLTWSKEDSFQLFAGAGTNSESKGVHNLPQWNKSLSFKLALAHRRLSILDLSPAGHQPMLLEGEDLAISYNGEIYNYIEVRDELVKLGRKFRTASDTEVILQAWAQWGKAALHKFNGMFAFVLVDSKLQKLYAVRDRFGVKPLYFTESNNYLAFASEVKQLRVLPDYSFQLNQRIAFDYLRHSLLDHATETFDIGIHQVMPGTLLEIDIYSCKTKTEKWYHLIPKKFTGSFDEACQEFRRLLKDSVRLRLRSDVPIGSALSGGLDSSTIVCLMREILEEQGVGNHALKTITSCQIDKRFDEFAYAQKIIEHVKAESHKVFPSFEQMLNELDKFIWHLDYPFGSTSQFSQWCVFEGAKKEGLTVMIDGQGADEQLAGYGGNDMALYTGLLGGFEWLELAKEAIAYRKYRGNWPAGFLIGAAQHYLPKFIVNKFPDKYLVRKNNPPQWLKVFNGGVDENWPSSLHQSLFQQVTRLPLPSLLRYEDRNSMAFSVESRVPFMDYRLIEFTMGLPEEFVYYRGERKRILRKAFRGKVPDTILDRKDKMGFLSSEEKWVKEEHKEWFMNEITGATMGLENFIEKNATIKMLNEIQEGKTPFNFEPWKIICLNRWKSNMENYK